MRADGKAASALHKACSSFVQRGKPGRISVVFETMGTERFWVKLRLQAFSATDTAATRRGAGAATRGGFSRGRAQEGGHGCWVPSIAMAKIARGERGLPFAMHKRSRFKIQLLEDRGKVRGITRVSQKDGDNRCTICLHLHCSSGRDTSDVDRVPDDLDH
jgi:hypothetical protein